MSNANIREATAADAGDMTSIAFAAKRRWGYPEEWISLWSGELTVDRSYPERHRAFLAEIDGRAVGWCAVADAEGGSWLDHCWVLPEAAGRGLGRLLVDRAFRLVEDSGRPAIRVVADPHAEGFYRKMGFRRIGYRPSLPPGRRLPVLEAALGGAAGPRARGGFSRR